MKCKQPPAHKGVLLTVPPQYRCDRKSCNKTWVVGTEPPECSPHITKNQILKGRCEICDAPEVYQVVDITKERYLDGFDTTYRIKVVEGCLSGLGHRIRQDSLGYFLEDYKITL
jgi:hypothetical protein